MACCRRKVPRSLFTFTPPLCVSHYDESTSHSIPIIQKPNSTGSISNRIPNRSSNCLAISTASARISAALAPPRLTSASVCREEMPAAPAAISLRKPGLLDQPSRWNFAPGPDSPLPLPRESAAASFPLALVAIAATAPQLTTGFLKKLPALRQSASAFHQQHSLRLANSPHGRSYLSQARLRRPQDGSHESLVEALHSVAWAHRRA